MVPLKHIKRLCQFAKDHNFSFPADGENKSCQYLRRQYNGIGAEWMPAFLRNLLIKLLAPMEAVALVQDIDFLSDNKSYWNFTKSNCRLVYNAFKSRYLFYGLLLGLLYQCFGWSAWREGKETMAWHYYFKEEEK